MRSREELESVLREIKDRTGWRADGNHETVPPDEDLILALVESGFIALCHPTFAYLLGHCYAGVLAGKLEAAASGGRS